MITQQPGHRLIFQQVPRASLVLLAARHRPKLRGNELSTARGSRDFGQFPILKQLKVAKCWRLRPVIAIRYDIYLYDCAAGDFSYC